VIATYFHAYCSGSISFESSLCYGLVMDTDDELFQAIIDSIEFLENEELWSQRVIDEQDDD